MFFCMLCYKKNYCVSELQKCFFFFFNLIMCIQVLTYNELHLITE